LLYPSTTGRELVLTLSRMQSNRISNAIKQSGMKDRGNLTRFLNAMINPDERKMMQSLIPSFADG